VAQYPTGVETCEITFGSALTFLGNLAEARVTITPILGGSTKSIVWAATGTSLNPFPETVRAESGLQGALTVPVVDQDGWIDNAGRPIKMWAYRVELYAELGGQSSITIVKTFQPVQGQEQIDLDMIADDTLVGAPVVGVIPAVTSVNGQTGAVTVLAGDLPPGDADGHVLTWDALNQDWVSAAPTGGTGGGTGGPVAIGDVTGLQDALSAKVTRPSNPTTASVLTLGTDGTVAATVYATTATPSSMARRGSDGSLTVALTPTQPGHAVSLSHLNTALVGANMTTETLRAKLEMYVIEPTDPIPVGAGPKSIIFRKSSV
jgi:hypothetical protein